MPRVVRGYKEAARSNIARAALEVFASKGFYGSTMEDIAQKLGVSKGALYQYFKSKEDLLKEIQASSRQGIGEELRRAFEDHEPIEGAELFFDAVFEKLGLRLRNALDIFSLASHDEKLRRILKEDHEKDLKVIEKFLDEQIRKGKISPKIDKRHLAQLFSAVSFQVLIELILGYTMLEVRKTWIESIAAILGGR